MGQGKGLPKTERIMLWVTLLDYPIVQLSGLQCIVCFMNRVDLLECSHSACVSLLAGVSVRGRNFARQAALECLCRSHCRLRP